METQGDDASFEERLRAARVRQGLDPNVRPAGLSGMSAWGLGTRVAVELVSAVAVGTLLGVGLDWFCHTSPAFIIVCMPLGFGAGVLNVWRVLGPRG